MRFLRRIMANISISYLEGDIPDADRSGSEQEGDLEDEDEQKVGRAAVEARLGLLRNQEQNPQQQDRAQLQYKSNF